MTIPNLPTDNLYKFVAMTGLILFVISILYTGTMDQELTSEITKLNGEIEAHSYERNTLDNQARRITSKIDELEDECKCGRHSVINDSLISFKYVNRPEATEIVDEILKLIEQKNELTRQISLKAIGIGTKRALIESKEENLRLLIDVVGFSIPFSFLMALTGFILWFERTQRYSDKLLKFEYLKSYKYQYCQSCGMYLGYDEKLHKYPTEEKIKTKFCTECFSDDQFTEAELTLPEMKLKVKKRCEELNLSKITTYFYVWRLDHLERWLPKFRWR